MTKHDDFSGLFNFPEKKLWALKEDIFWKI